MDLKPKLLILVLSIIFLVGCQIKDVSKDIESGSMSEENKEVNATLENTGKTIENDENIASPCIDSDKGIDYAKKGYVTLSSLDGDEERYYDDCDKTILLENYCGGDKRFVTRFSCPDQCFDGRCVTGMNISETNIEVKANVSASNSSCLDSDKDGFPSTDSGFCEILLVDCNDDNAAIYPGAPEICGNDIDENCDNIDVTCALNCTDNDNDGYGKPASNSCLHSSLDCNDDNPDVYPGATEICGNGIDENCNGADSICLTICNDLDNDGYGSPASSACQFQSIDCNDNNANINPGKNDVCGNNVDENCDGTDLTCPVACVDLDQDGYGKPASASCTFNVLDCNDNNANINPGKNDVCGNNVDENCDGSNQLCSSGKTFFVSTAGNDNNQGTSSSPWKTIQKCLNTVKAGETCQVSEGTYNEALALKITGTASDRITLKCATNKGCTVNSGNARSLVAPPGQKGYYTIDGFRFISTLVDNSHPSKMGTVNFAFDYWGDGAESEKGNDGFILRNCYIEGAVYFYGSDNLVENCELNGKRRWVTDHWEGFSNGLIEAYAPSENNVFRKNIIHEYTQRGGWSLQYTRNTLWENNTIYNTGTKEIGGDALDCDGAGAAVYGCNIRGNHLYNVNGEVVILMENAFDSVIENNIIHDSTQGIGVINYNINNGADPFKSDKDYKGLVTNTIIRNNVIYNIINEGFQCKAVRGNKFVNNTLYNIKTSRGYWDAITLSGYTQFYCPETIIKNNIVAGSAKTFFYEGNPSVIIDNNFYESFSAHIYDGGSKTFSQWQAMGFDVNSKIGDPLFVNAAAGDFHLQANSPACGKGAFPCSSAQIPPLNSGKTYYVSNSGNDANSGTSETAPWKTLAKVRSVSYNPGDRILLKAGGVWNEGMFNFPSSGSSNNNILFGRYGTGVNPIINSDVYSAIKISGKSYITIDGIDIKNAESSGITIIDSSFITIKNTYITHVGGLSGAISFGDGLNSHDILVENFKFVGGGRMGWGFSGAVRNFIMKRGTIDGAGQAAEYQTHGMYISDWHDFVVEDINISRSWNSGIKIVGNTYNGVFRRVKITESGRSGSSGPGIAFGDSNSDRKPYIHNLKFENCVIANSNSLAFWNIDGLNNVQNITIDHCTLINNVGSINFKSGSAGWRVTNNIGYEDTVWNSNNLRNPLMWDSESNVQKNYFDNNIWYFKNGAGIHNPVKIAGTTISFSQWQAKSGHPDQHSMSIDPKVIPDSFKPQPDSPVCGAGSDGTDIGAFSC